MTPGHTAPDHHGLPLVRTLGAAFERSRVAAGGVIVATRAGLSGDRSPASLGYRCTLDDGTGRVDLLFIGRRLVPGLTVGARCEVEGTARMDSGRLTLWNPLYRLERAGCGEDPPGRSVRG